MKKLFLAIILICCFVTNTNAFGPMTLLATDSGSSCPLWVNSTIIGWNGDHKNGTNYM